MKQPNLVSVTFETDKEKKPVLVTSNSKQLAASL